MKKLVFILMSMVLGLRSYSQSTLLAGVQNQAVEYISSWGSTPAGYIYLPWDYYTSGKTYPIIFFFCGDGEKGTDVTTLLNQGLPKNINEGEPPYSVSSAGDTTWFIVVSPQVASGTQANMYTMNYWYNTVKKYSLRFDSNRVYLTGLSAGGSSVDGMIGSAVASSTDWQPAAEVVMSPHIQMYSYNVGDMYNCHIWFMQGDEDATIGTKGIANYNIINSTYPDNDTRLTVHPGEGHCCWDEYYDPTWKSNDTSVYDYLMLYSLANENQHPVANAGDDQIINSGITTATLMGSGTDPDGSIVSYHWTTSSTASITDADADTTTVTGLEDGNTYTFTLTVTDDSAATASDDVTLTVLTPDEPQDTPIYKIALNIDTKMWHGDTMFYQINDIHSSGIIDSLFDEQSADPLNGVTTPTPITIFQSGATTKTYYPAQVVVDLGGVYKLTDEYYYTLFGTDSLYLQYGEPLNWSSDTLKSYTGGSGWRNFKDTIYTRYLKIFYANKGNQKVYEFMLYGHSVGDTLSRVNSDPHTAPTKTDLTMGQFIGFNQIGPREVDSVGSLMRHYQSQDWMDTVTTTHNIDSIIFAFTKFGHYTNNTSTTASTSNYFFPDKPTESTVKSGMDLTANDLHQMALNGTGYFDATLGSPTYAGAGAYKPIDTVNHPDDDATNPDDYDRMARMMWNYAAYYGFQTHSSDSMQTPYPTISGLGLRAFVESGNEMNQTWSTRARHYTPQEFIAYSSAYYDGNLGSMGDRMGVKAADPNMKVIAAGTAGADLDNLKGMQYYSYYARSDHSTPFDILNFHTYATNGVNGDGTQDHAFSPENYFGDPNNLVKRYIQTANSLFPGMPIWLTEWGYDRNGATTVSVPRFREKTAPRFRLTG